MIEIIVARYIASKANKQKREGFSDPDVDVDVNLSPILFWALVGVSALLWVGFGVLGVYLSWRSNGKANWGPGARAVFAFFAFLFGLSYITSHVLHKLDLLSAIDRLRRTAAVAAAVAAVVA